MNVQTAEIWCLGGELALELILAICSHAADLLTLAVATKS